MNAEDKFFPLMKLFGSRERFVPETRTLVASSCAGLGKKIKNIFQVMVAAPCSTLKYHGTVLNHETVH